jgi:photosystem II stability/assembly factor-like uncharacterized protein
MTKHMIHRAVRLAASISLTVVFAVGAAGSVNLPKGDPLIRPAPVTARGASAMLTAVTRAGERLVAVGERGIILRSDDNGLSWTQSRVPVSVLLTGVRFASARKGWAVGHSGVVLRTEDGGATWSKQLDGIAAAQIVMEEVRASSGGDPAARLKLAAAERLVNDGADKPFFDLHVESENVALIVGAYGLIYRTDDAGKTWKSWQDHIPNFKGAHLYAVRSGGNKLYLAGEQGTFFLSTDKGNTFSEIKTPYAGSYFGVAVTSEQSIVLFGLRGHSYWSDDGGTTWRDSQIGVQASLNGAAVLKNGALVLISQAGNIVRSTDGGKSFSPMPVPNPAPFVGITEAGDGSLILVGARGITRLPAFTAAAQKS